jgi:hypothetical protein
MVGCSGPLVSPAVEQCLRTRRCAVLSLQKSVVSFAADFAYAVGFNQLKMTTPLLQTVRLPACIHPARDCVRRALACETLWIIHSPPPRVCLVCHAASGPAVCDVVPWYVTCLAALHCPRFERAMTVVSPSGCAPLSHPVLVHTPCSIGMSHMAECTCCSSVAFERPNENTFTFTFTPRLQLCRPSSGMLTDVILFILFALSVSGASVREPRLCAFLHSPWQALSLPIQSHAPTLPPLPPQVILIYNLLMINVQKRTFEVPRSLRISRLCAATHASPSNQPPLPVALLQIAVRRLLGSSRTLLAALLGIQVSLYAIPAWIIGLIIAQIMSRMILMSFRGSSGLPVQTRLTGVAVGYATGTLQTGGMRVVVEIGKWDGGDV